MTDPHKVPYPGRAEGPHLTCPLCKTPDSVPPPVFNQTTGLPEDFAYCQSCGKPMQRNAGGAP